MFTPATVLKQYEAAHRDDLRILIVGAGIAGVTVEQLLRRSGRHPVLIERGDGRSAAGYMLALMPLTTLRRSCGFTASTMTSAAPAALALSAAVQTPYCL